MARYSGYLCSCNVAYSRFGDACTPQFKTNLHKFHVLVLIGSSNHYPITTSDSGCVGLDSLPSDKGMLYLMYVYTHACVDVKLVNRYMWVDMQVGR